MFEKFFPDETVASTYEIDFESFYKKGFRGILFDIDNTLVEHGMDATERAVELFRHLKQLGFECCLISNNKKQRVSRFNKKIGAHMIFNARKPRRKSYLDAMRQMGTDTGNTLFVGDQLFTDIWGAKRCGIRNVLVKPINKREEIQIVIKRYFEKVILWEYHLRECRRQRKSGGKAGKTGGKKGKENESNVFYKI